MAKAVVTIHDWGTPDPRDGAAYPPASLTTLAWEFLRRSEPYRRCWQKLQRDNGSKEITELPDGKRTTVWRALSVVLQEEFRVYSREADRFDPRDRIGPLFEGAEVVIEVKTQSDPVEPPKVLVEFDLTLPIESQLDCARKLLRRKAGAISASRKPHPDKLVLYLRLLDFESQGAPDAEIGKYLFPTLSGERLRNAIRTNFKAARQWQDDYLILACHLPS